MTAPHRRQVLGGLLATAGAVAAGSLLGCTNDDRSPAASGPTPSVPPGAGDPTDLADGLDPAAVPDTATVRGWIEEIVERGIRRPGYPADKETETALLAQLRAEGLQRVRLEPVPVDRWEPHATELVVAPEGQAPRTLDAFAVPYAAPTTGVDLELVPFDPDAPGSVRGAAALVDARVVRLPPAALATAGSAPADPAGRVHDPEGTFAADEHVLPHTADRRHVFDGAIDAGAAAVIGTLLDYPGGGREYYVPYDGEARPVPGVWISGTDGAWLHEQLARGPLRVRLTVDATTTPTTSHNVVAELDGADDHLVIIGSHHDGPWASAVEDASGTALVLAQARFWAAQPRERRPHRMVFVLHAGHMCGSAGQKAYLAAHAEQIERTVLQVHLEHAALEAEEDEDGQLVATDRCTPRWFFTSLSPTLETTVFESLVAEDLTRSLIVAPDALGANPPTDGGAYHRLGVPVVQFLAAPSYLFDPADTLDKVDVAHLVPLTRAFIRILASTRSVGPAEFRRT